MDAAVMTFAIPFYRGLDYFERAVASVFAQTVPNWRLLVCDDSPDGAAAAVLAARPDPRVRYERNGRTLGMAATWNRCIDLAETELVTVLHADDELLPDYAKAMVAAADAEPQTTAMFCRARIIDSHGRPMFSFPDRVKDLLIPSTRQPVLLQGPAGIAALLRGNFVICPTVCYRKRRLGTNRFDERWRFVLDLDLFTRLLAEGHTMFGVPHLLYAYRRHAGNATAEYTESLLRFREEVALYDEWAAGAAARDWAAVARVGRAKRVILLHLAFRVTADAARGRLASSRMKLAYLASLLRRNGERLSD